jgi:DNA-binding NarL/FixJ family response regulator
MELVHNNMLPGLTDDATEFFAVGENELEAFNGGGRKKFSDLPSRIHDILRAGMDNMNATIDEVKAFARKYYGGLDCSADISSDGLLGKPDYVKTEKTLELGNGSHLTECELKVLRLITLPDKIIADKLCISEKTVLTHMQNIRSKTGLASKPELSHMATKMGII